MAIFVGSGNSTFLRASNSVVGVGLGTTSAAGRSAGVGTALGELIFNADDGNVEVFTGTEWKIVGEQQPPFTATGGTLDTTSRAGWNVHTFASPGTLTVVGPDKAGEYFMVGGAGSAGDSQGGGGGAGAIRADDEYTFTAGSYPVTSGSGGTDNAPSNKGNPGQHSVFGSITATGGGGGGGNHQRNADPGGSGGGAAISGTNNGSGGTATGSGGGTTNSNSPGSGWGNGGGNGYHQQNAGGGGGGAGGGGGTGGGQGGGQGGQGLQYSIKGSESWYAGGGGGGSQGGSGGTGGSGGAGSGASTDSGSGQQGQANTGGGGGGSGGNPGTPGTGGSGVVIIAYPTS